MTIFKILGPGYIERDSNVSMMDLLEVFEM